MMTMLDPVCGMTVDPERAAGSFDYHGQTCFFCSVGCLNKFQADPERYLNQPAPQAIKIGSAPVVIPTSRDSDTSRRGREWPRSTEYTCPMHPEIVRDAPGSCPICGMALEPRTITVAEEENPELVDMARRFWVSVVLGLPVFLIGMNDIFPGRPLERVVSMDALGWIQF